MLTRSVGREPTVQVDYYTAQVNRGDCLVQCSDGLHHCVTEEEICEIVTHAPPEEACRQLVELAEKRGTDDNLSVQIVEIHRVEQLMYYRGLPIYHEAEMPMSHELEVGDVLDERFQITDVISRSGMASIFKAKDRKTGQVVAVKVPFMQFESDPAFYSRFQREEEIGRKLDHPYILHIVPVGRQEPALHRHGVAQGADAAAGDAEHAGPAGGRCRWTSPAASAKPWSTCTSRTSSTAT